METRRLIAAAATLCTLAVAQADVFMSFSVFRRHYQTNAMTLRFDRGDLSVFLRDGLVILDGACVIDPQLFFFGPSDIPPCPLGATAFIAAGDVDRDGIHDDNQYWSVASVVPALVIEPSRQDLVQLYSAPASKLPRPLQNFLDGAVVTFYDISSAVVQQYDQSRYELVRNYGSVPQVETAVAIGDIIVGGTLDVQVSGLDIVGSPVSVPVAVAAGDTSVAWADAVRVALAANPAITSVYAVGGGAANITLTELTPNGNDPTLNISLLAGTAAGPGLPSSISLNTTMGTVVASPAAALKQMKEELVSGQYVFTFPRLDLPEVPVAVPVNLVPIVEAVDPASRSRQGFRFTSGLWDGEFYQMDPRRITTLTWQGNDSTVVRPNDQLFFSILNPTEDFLTFPPTVPQNPVFLSPTAQSYTIPPFFYEVGEEGMLNIQYTRFLPSNGVAFDTSQREFRAKIRMVDSFPGYVQLAAPLGTAKADLAPTGNIDRDSMSNIEEFAFQYPTNEHINASVNEQFVPQPVALPGFPPVVEEFSRVISKVPEQISNAAGQPAAPAAPFLDVDNHIVFEVPLRPRTGTTLRYDIVEITTTPKGKVKAKKLKLAGNWTTSIREVDTPLTSVFPATTIEVKIIDAATRDVYDIRQRLLGPPPPTQPVVNLTQEILVLRSVNPVNPADPLPNLGVKLTPIALR